MYRAGLFVALLVVATSGALRAAEPEPPAPVREALARLVPEAKPGSVREAAVAGLWEVTYGAKVYYLTADGRYLIGGPLVDLGTRANLTEAAARRERRRLLASVSAADMVIFAPPKPRHTITVFTDIDCHYCRKLHSQVKEYNARGIAVRYLAFPRTGPQGESADKARAVWCAKDRQDAMTRAKRGEAVKARKCDDPVAREYALGTEMDITGTPALLLEDGRLLSGYMAPDALARLLEGG